MGEVIDFPRPERGLDFAMSPLPVAKKDSTSHAAATCRVRAAQDSAQREYALIVP